MSDRNGLRPSVQIHNRIVLGFPSYVLSIGKENVAFDNIADVVHRLVMHFEPPQEKKEKKPKREGKVKKPSLKKWVMFSVRKPMTTTEIHQKSVTAGLQVTRDSVYATMWHLKSKNHFTQDPQKQEYWVPKP